VTQSTGSASPTDKAREQVQQVAGQAQERAQEAAQQAQSRMRGEVDSRSTQAGEVVVSTAQDLKSVAESLREQGKDAPARMADGVAERVERVGSYLRDSDGERILGDVEGFVRRQPWTVVVGGLTLGFVASRFLKASSGDRYRLQQSSRSSGYGDSPPLPAAGDLPYTSSYGRGGVESSSYGRGGLDVDAPLAGSDTASFDDDMDRPVDPVTGAATPYAGDPLLDETPSSGTTSIDERLEGLDDDRSSRP
jgi:ElaB/YqjD/DUF883 family membrane-anchored ribosome-binding protein